MSEKRSTAKARRTRRNSSKRPKPRLCLSLKSFAHGNQKCIARIRRGITAAHQLLGSSVGELSIAIISASEIARLHKQYLNDPTPTDVLTFELGHDSRGRAICGEIVICADIAESRAKSLGHPVCHELLLYAIHGLLHLCGFDDRTARGFAEMHAKEDQILTRLGIGPVFSGNRSAR